MQANLEPVVVSKKAIWAGRIVSALPVMLLLFSAAMKLAKTAAVIEGFSKFGYPEHLLRVLGVVELTCTLIYIFPPTAVLGAILLTGYLGGATATHARMDDPQFIMPVVVGVLVWLGLFLREPRLRKLIPLSSSPSQS